MGQEKYPSITPDLNANGHKIFEYESCTHTPKTTNPIIISNKYITVFSLDNFEIYDHEAWSHS